MSIVDGREFRTPSPTEMFLLVAAVWAGLCLVIMLFSERVRAILIRASRTAADLVSGSDIESLLPIIMVTGVLAIASAFAVFSRWEKGFIVALLVSFSFADSTWAAGHYLAFAVKYLAIIYLGAFGIFFAFRNWNRVHSPVHWLVIAYCIWMAIIVIYYGGRINDIWYLGTQFTLMIAFGIGWMSRIDTVDKLMSFNILMAYTAIGITMLHMLSPLVAPQVFDGGRFISQFTNATGFATSYVFFVISLVWLAIVHPQPMIRRLATIFALFGVVMIVLSGTRNATAALGCAIIFLSIALRSKVVFYAAGIAGFAALSVFLLVGDNDAVTNISGRMASVNNTRIELWEVYIRSTFERPIFGWGPGGRTGAYYGSRAQELAEAYTSRGFAPGVHNAILGQTVRFGYLGLVLFISLFGYAFWRAKEIILSKGVPQSLKVAYSLPVAILVTLFLEGAFEDNFSAGRGSIVNVLFATMVILVVMFADRIKDHIASGSLSPDEMEEIKLPEPPKKLVHI
jgi:O-antigen ligase